MENEQNLPTGANPVVPEQKKIEDKKDFFLIDRGERTMYQNANPTDKVMLPLTRDGFEALIERACNFFVPALPIDDSIRKVFAGWVHHLENSISAVTIEQVADVLYKSIANSLTWTVDQEIKQKYQLMANQERARALALAEENAKQQKIAFAQKKRSGKAAKKLTVKVAGDETKVS